MLARPLLVLSSYAPLFALFALRIETGWLRWAFGALSVVGVPSLVLIFLLARRSEPTHHVVKKVRGPGAEAGGYLAGFFLPFVVDASPTTVDLVAYVLFLVVAGIVTGSTGAIQVNPLLYIVGHRVVTMTDDRGFTTYVIVRGELAPTDEIWLTRLRDGVAMRRSAPTTSPFGEDRV